jgi:hypothetical protein
MSLICPTAHFPNQDFHLRIIMQKRNQNDRKIFVVAIYAAVLSLSSVPQLKKKS